MAWFDPLTASDFAVKLHEHSGEETLVMHCSSHTEAAEEFVDEKLWYRLDYPSEVLVQVRGKDETKLVRVHCEEQRSISTRGEVVELSEEVEHVVHPYTAR